MAKLTRYLQKIFANNSNEVGVFGTGVDKETSKNVETLQSSDYENGWSSAIITNKNYPIWQEMDGVQYGLSYQLKYLFQNGIPEWLSTETYYTNSYCRYGSDIYYSLQDDNTNHNPALNDGWWTPLLTSSRSIGEIVTSTIPLTDAGLHLLDGALLQYGSYQAFVDYIADLYDSGDYTAIFETEANWQTAVTTYGVCGKFVYDSVNNTVRLPKYGNQIYTKDIASTAPVIGNGDPLGLTYSGLSDTYRVSFYGDADRNNVSKGVYDISTGTSAGGGDNGVLYSVHSNPVASGMIANLSDITTSLDGYYYIVIATSTKTDIQVDIDEVVTDLNGKADTDLTNVNNQAKILMSDMAMPSSTKISLTLGASGATYTAPANGWVMISKRATVANQYLYLINSTSGLSAGGFATVAGYDTNVFLPVRKSDVFSVAYSMAGNTIDFVFIYAKGSESEAS